MIQENSVVFLYPEYMHIHAAPIICTVGSGFYPLEIWTTDCYSVTICIDMDSNQWHHLCRTTLTSYSLSPPGSRLSLDVLHASQ